MKTILLCFLLSFATAFVASPATASDSTAKADVTFDLDFAGGSFDDLLKTLADASGEWPNVMVGQEAREVDLPPFRLVSVSLEEVFGALSGLAQVPQSALSGISIDKFEGVIVVKNYRKTGEEASKRRFVSVFQIGSLLDDLQIQDVTTSIETAWGMAGDETVGQLRFHEETALLFVEGTGDQIGLADDVLDRMAEREENR